MVCHLEDFLGSGGKSLLCQRAMTKRPLEEGPLTLPEKQAVCELEKVLLLKPEWLDHILSGRKDLEIRARSAQWAGPIGLATGCELHGYCKVVSSRPVSREELLALQHRTCCPPELINYKQPWVWELTEVHRLSDPLSLPRKKGQVVWVRVHGPSLLPPPAGDANQKAPSFGLLHSSLLLVGSGSFGTPDNFQMFWSTWNCLKLGCSKPSANADWVSCQGAKPYPGGTLQSRKLLMSSHQTAVRRPLEEPPQAAGARGCSDGGAA